MSVRRCQINLHLVLSCGKLTCKCIVKCRTFEVKFRILRLGTLNRWNYICCCLETLDTDKLVKSLINPNFCILAGPHSHLLPTGGVYPCAHMPLLDNNWEFFIPMRLTY